MQPKNIDACRSNWTRCSVPRLTFNAAFCNPGQSEFWSPLSLHHRALKSAAKLLHALRWLHLASLSMISSSANDSNHQHLSPSLRNASGARNLITMTEIESSGSPIVLPIAPPHFLSRWFTKFMDVPNLVSVHSFNPVSFFSLVRDHHNHQNHAVATIQAGSVQDIIGVYDASRNLTNF